LFASVARGWGDEVAYAEHEWGSGRPAGGRRGASNWLPPARPREPARPPADFRAAPRPPWLDLRAPASAAPPFASNDGAAPVAPELLPLEAHLDEPGLRAASIRAARIGVGADQVLIAAGAIEESAYIAALATHLGLAFDPLTHLGRAAVPLTAAQWPGAAQNGIMPVMGETGLHWVIAPRGLCARRLCALIEERPYLAARLRLTSPARLRDFIQRAAREDIGAFAEGHLRATHPELSAAPRKIARHLGQRLRRIALTGLLGVAIALAPSALFALAGQFLAAWFLGFIGLRLFASLIDHGTPKRIARLSEDRLPVYTIIAALYRESSSVEGLLAAFEAFDYPREKLDIKLAVEEDDLTTRAAIARVLQSGAIKGPVDVIVAPPHGPRTKPKALNAALAFARGTFTVIYDAEDRPEPGQLRGALDAFLRHGERCACAQASLCIDNGADSWLTRMFAAEYAGQFDVFLPGFSRLQLPLPLGGSSNHFRTSALRDAGGWDAYNVTEDADLGLRLARFGYRTVTFHSTTFEEAPARFGPWLRQRTRWMKGWMQTWAVHMRDPALLWRQIGARGFITLQLAIGGNVVAALIHPIFLIAMLANTARHLSGDLDSNLGAGLLDLFNAMVVATGYLASVLIGWMGLDQRRMRASAWVLALIPIYWLLLSLAAWRALWQFMRAPYQWEKTDHGFARSSLRRELLARAAR